MLVKTAANTYLICLYHEHDKHIYTIPVGSAGAGEIYLPSDTKISQSTPLTFICTTTSYMVNYFDLYTTTSVLTARLKEKFDHYKPIYFDRFKYVGKGFKLIFKKKKKLFNCVFGHSHIY